MSKKYSIEFKKKLKDKLESVNENSKIDMIKEIIFKHNPDLSYTQNSSGVLLFFHNLNPLTYDKLEHLIIKFEHNKIKKITSTMTDEDNNISISESISTTKLNFNPNKNNVRLNSLEKNLIKKKDYFEKLEYENNNAINTNSNISEDENIFLHKNEDTVHPIKIEPVIKRKRSKCPAKVLNKN
jgi:hypothetical protein